MAKLDALKEKLGDHLNEKRRAALMNIRYCESAWHQKARTVLPKATFTPTGDFHSQRRLSRDNPRLSDHRPAALATYTAASSTSSSTADDFAKYKIAGNETREALVYGVSIGRHVGRERDGGGCWGRCVDAGAV